MFKFINEGNGIEGIIETTEIRKEESKKMKLSVVTKNLIWDPVFEQFIEKENTAELEKGTVALKNKQKTLD